MAPSHAPISQATKAKSDDADVKAQGDSALVSAKRNFKYMISPSTAVDHPSKFRTRALLRTLNYVFKFLFWKLVRYAKFVAVGSLVAAIGATAFGGAISGVAWVAAPPTFGASIIAATVWYMGKWGAQRLQKRLGKFRTQDEADQAEETDSPVRRDGTWRQETGPGAAPW